MSERPLEDTSRDDLDRMGSLLKRATDAESKCTELKATIILIVDERALAFEMLMFMWEHAHDRVDWYDGEDEAAWAAERAPAMIEAYKARLLKTLIFDDEKRCNMWMPPPPEEV